MLNSKQKIKAIMLVIMAIVGYLLWLWSRPVKIIAIHQSGSYSDVLVKDYPLTDTGKMDWWLKNKEVLKEKYNIPKPDEDGGYHVVFWDFDKGYKEEGKYDRLCFEDMHPPKNCIDKNKLITVGRNKYNVTDFTVSGGVYFLQDNGLIVKRKRQE
ncbi:DUF943 family protein [Erwinia rhapontici]|nr:DUF943 family protein [Erwinia rhapontici]MBP2154763.1 hypothetical protein [Erwinia rhapontici]NKG31079.1 DUF943 family protein [Erwinia rhapontici]